VSSDAYLSVLKELDDSNADPASARFNVALDKLRQLAESADIDACEALAEILCAEPSHHDPAASYRWYYVALSQQGYSVTFHDLNHTTFAMNRWYQTSFPRSGLIRSRNSMWRLLLG
jgi:hypothetical protein